LNLNQLEAKFSQEERRIEKEIISLNIQLEEAKQIEEVMKIQMMNKEEEVEKLEEEIITLRDKIFKISKNIENIETCTSSIENVEEKHSRLPKKKNEENNKSYAKVLKGRNHGLPKSNKNDRS
jgi:septal ring factor EnvC (AmiA/AmiB activator)